MSLWNVELLFFVVIVVVFVVAIYGLLSQLQFNLYEHQRIVQGADFQ